MKWYCGSKPFFQLICLACREKKMEGEEKFIGLLIFTIAYKLMHPRNLLVTFVEFATFLYNYILNCTRNLLVTFMNLNMSCALGNPKTLWWVHVNP